MTYDWRVLTGVIAVSAVVGWLLVRQPAEPDLDAEEIDRDLATLAEGLRYDQSLEDYVHPPTLTDMAFPNTIVYRRPAKFWEAAFKPSHR